MRRPMPDTDKPGTWPAVGVSRLALNKKLMKIRKDHPVFSNAGSQDIKNINLLSQEWPFEQITVLRETEDEVGILVFNCADHEVNPRPEVQLPPNCIAKKGAKFVDLLAHTPETFLVNDGGKVYAGPCGPNSVKVLLYEKPKPSAAAAEARAGRRRHPGSPAAAGRRRAVRAAAAAAAAAPAYDPAAVPAYDPAAYAAYEAAQADAAAAAAAMAAQTPADPTPRRPRRRRPRTIPTPRRPRPAAAPAYDPYARRLPRPRRPGVRSLAAPPPARRGGGGAGAAPPAADAYDPYAAPPPPPPPSFLDQWKNDRQ